MGLIPHHRRAISRASALFTAGLVASALGLSACGGGSTPTAPSMVGATTIPPPVTPVPPPAPSVPAVTFTVRSGAEGLPTVPGATIRVGDTSLATNAQGTVSLDGLTGPVSYLVEAPGHLSYRSLVTSPLTEVVLWPWQPGMTGQWVSLTSYYGPDYNVVLWRPDRDVLLDLQGVLASEPYRSVWHDAVREVAGAIDSGGRGAPSVRMASGPGTVPVRLNEAPTCQASRWGLVPPVLAPPPVVTISAEPRARDPEVVLAMVAYLVGFHLELSRRIGPPQSGGRLSAIERTALRMRMLRPPGTTLLAEATEDTTATVAEGTDAYWCR